MKLLHRFLIILFSITCLVQLDAQNFNKKNYKALEYRLIGPFRGGRSAAVTGVPNKPNLFYFGATGGGIWKTSNGGREWENISDGFLGNNANTGWKKNGYPCK